MVDSPLKTRPGRERALPPRSVRVMPAAGQATRRLRFDSSLISAAPSCCVRASGLRLNTRKLMCSTAFGSSPFALPDLPDRVELARRDAAGGVAVGRAPRPGPAVGGRPRAVDRPARRRRRRRRGCRRGRRHDRARGGRAAADRLVGVEVQPHAEERRALLQRVRRRGLQVVAERDERARLPLARHLAHAEVHLHEALGAELGQHEHLVLADLVLHDLERPRALQRLVQALDHAVALHVVEHPVAPLALLDLRRGERRLQQLPVHRVASSVVSGLVHAQRAGRQPGELHQLALGELADEPVDAVGQHLHRAPQLRRLPERRAHHRDHLVRDELLNVPVHRSAPPPSRPGRARRRGPCRPRRAGT